MATTVRVHELAKELNLTSKETIALLSKVGIRATTHMSVIDEHRAQIVKGVLLGNLAKAAKTHKPIAKQTAGNGAPVTAEMPIERPKAAAKSEVAPPAPAATATAPSAASSHAAAEPQLKPVPATV